MVWPAVIAGAASVLGKSSAPAAGMMGGDSSVFNAGSFNVGNYDPESGGEMSYMPIYIGGAILLGFLTLTIALKR